MAAEEPFTFVTETGLKGPPQLFQSFHDDTSAKVANVDVQLVTELRTQYPELIVTTIPPGNVNLLQFAAAGFASAELDTEDEPKISWRGFLAPPQRRSGGGAGSLGETTFFAKYRYTWHNTRCILYSVIVGLNHMQYVLTEPRQGETTRSSSRLADALIVAIGKWLLADEDIIYVFDTYWSASKGLWEQVKKASWDRVILDQKMKDELRSVSSKFFDSKDVYDEYGVPWRRGLIFHGPVGNGKTVSIKALMHTLYDRKPKIPSLYVKAAPQTYQIRAVFQFARSMAPCLLVIEDIETVVTPVTRSYFFNEVDGLESNDGILMIATTNYLDRLDPGLSKRPSRFDRKYLFPLPSLGERILYCEYWQGKLENKPNVDFPQSLCPPIARLMDDFSFAYMQEAFVAALLVLAREDDLEEDLGTVPQESSDNADWEQYEFYRLMKRMVKVLREDMSDSSSLTHQPPYMITHESEPTQNTPPTAPDKSATLINMLAESKDQSLSLRTNPQSQGQFTARPFQ